MFNTIGLIMSRAISTQLYRLASYSSFWTRRNEAENDK